MKYFERKVKNFYCAFCRSPRTMNMQKHVKSFEIAISMAGSFLLMLLIFQNLDFRVLVFFALFVSLFEFFVQLKYRLSMACPQCGFDPLLYMKSKEKACEQVKAHLEARKNNPAVYMSNRTALNLPVITTKKDNMGRDQRSVSKPHVAKNLDLRL
jgi:hypothetical protein